MLVIVCGQIASGKTTIAKYISNKINGTILRTDILRKKLYPNPKYTKDENQQVYNSLFDEVEKMLKSKNVILDATFYQEKNRERAKQIASKLNIDFKIVEVVCSNEEIIKRRIENRKDNVSKTNYKEYLKIKSIFEPIKEKHIIIINNSNSLKNAYQQIDSNF